VFILWFLVYEWIQTGGVASLLMAYLSWRIVVKADTRALTA